MKDGFKRLLIFALVFFILLSGLIFVIINNSRLRPNRQIHGWNTEEQIKKEKAMRSSEEKSAKNEFSKSY
jgi:lipopolysaccharide export LptBFGC system permease protein LptF